MPCTPCHPTGPSAVQIATRASFDSLLTARVTGGVPGAGALVDGDVRLLQRDSLPFPYAGVYAPYKNSPLLDLNDVTSVQQLSAASILTQYRQRNCECASLYRSQPATLRFLWPSDTPARYIRSCALQIP